jgi:hypothetical protein
MAKVGFSVVKDQQQLTGEGHGGEGRLLLQIVKIRVAAADVGEELALFRRVGSRGDAGSALGFGAGRLEALEFLGDLANRGLEAMDHATDAIEESGFGFEDIAQSGSIFHGGLPDLRFGILETVETPECGGELVDALLFGGVLGRPGV